MFDFRPSALRSSLSDKNITRFTLHSDPYCLPSHISLSQRNVRNRIKSISRMAEGSKPTINESKYSYFHEQPATMTNSVIPKKKLNKVSVQKNNNEYLIRKGTEERLIELQRKIVKGCRPSVLDIVPTTQSRCSIINYLEEDIQPKSIDGKAIKALKRVLIKKHKFELLRAFYKLRLQALR